MYIMGSHLNGDELEELASNMDREVLINTIKIGFVILGLGCIYILLTIKNV